MHSWACKLTWTYACTNWLAGFLTGWCGAGGSQPGDAGDVHAGGGAEVGGGELPVVAAQGRARPYLVRAAHFGAAYR